MSKEDKMKMTLKRIEEDRMRAKQQLPLLKKNEIKKKLFITHKKVYDLSSGYAICTVKIPDKDGYFFGLSNGTVLYFDCKTEKINTAVKAENSPVLDLVALTGDRLITVDDYSRIKIYNDYKLVKILPNLCAFVNNSFNYSKILVGNENYLFMINPTNDGITKLNLSDYSFENISLNRGKLFQIQLQDDKLFALSEEGYLVCCELGGIKGNPDDIEAEMNNPEGIDISEVKIEDLTNDQIGIAQKLHHSEEQLEASLILESESVMLNNSSSGQNEEGGEDNMKDSQSLTQSQQSYNRMNRIFNIPVKSMFFRSLAVSQDYIALASHDGQGHNLIYLYSHKLALLAFKYLKIESSDFSFNLQKYLHKLEIIQRKECTYIVAVTHRKDYKLYIYKFANNEITLFKRYKNIHSNLIMDLRFDGFEGIVTSSKDRKVQFYTMDFKFDFK